MDFLLMLGQLVGAAVPTPATASPATATNPLLRDSEEATTDTEAGDVIAALPLSLPMMPVEIKPDAGAAAQSTTLLAVTTEISQSRSLSAESQMMADLLQQQTDQNSALDTPLPFELPQLQAPAVEPAQTARHTSVAEAHARSPVHAPVGSGAWADEVGSRLTMMVEQGKHTASLRLSPEHLGPLEIRIAMNDDQASVWFGAAHADTRAAIESALPRLRELFAAQGLSLTDAGVSREPPREQPTPQSQSTSGGAIADGSSDSVAVSTRVQLGLLDTYA